MKIFDLIGMGFRNLWRRKLRTLLTVLGVVIGTSSIIVMLSLGIALNIQTEQQIEQMGGINKIEVRPSWETSRNSRNKEYSEPVITEKQVKALRQIEGISSVVPSYQVNVSLVSGKYSSSHATIIGMTPEAMEEAGLKLQSGRLLQEDDELQVIFGNRVSQQFYNPKARGRKRWEEVEIDIDNDPIEMSFDDSFGRYYKGMEKSKKKPKVYRLENVGVLASGDWERDSSIFMNLDYLKKLKKEYDRQKAKEDAKNSNDGNRRKTTQEDGYASADAYAEDFKEIPQLIEQIQALELEAYSYTEYLEEMKKQSATVKSVLGAIGAVSLLVAAIGITNTMVMSIYERTKEIGVMKVIGAKLRDIKYLFLFEAGMIGLLGGIMGIAISCLLSYLANKYGADSIGAAMGGGMMMGGGEEEAVKISVIPVWLNAAALVFSTLIGLISGFYPAVRATRLSALEAIRTE